MKQLSDQDIEQMATGVFRPDTRAVNRAVRAELKLSKLIPAAPDIVPQHARLDLHRMTEEQAWCAIMDLLKSGARRATIITGASGILKPKFQQWARESVMTPYIREIKPINNGSFEISIKNQCNQ